MSKKLEIKKDKLRTLTPSDLKHVQGGNYVSKHGTHKQSGCSKCPTVET